MCFFRLGLDYNIIYIINFLIISLKITYWKEN